MLSESKKKYTSPGVRQCLKILSWIARSPQGIGFNELRERVFQLPGATMTRHLKVLLEENWVVKDDRGLYLPGPAYLCAVTNLTGRPDPEAMVRPVLDRLAQESGQSAALAEWDRGGIRFRFVKEMARSYRYPDGTELLRDVFEHPFGLTALAYLSDSLVEWNWESRPGELPGTAEELHGKLERIRTQGFWVETYGCCRVCAPVLYGNGDLMGVIGLSVLGEGERFVPMVMDAARDLEKTL